MVDRDDKKLTFMPTKDAKATKGHVFAYHDYSWCVCPDRGFIFYNGHPQANMNPSLAADLCRRLYPWAHVETHGLVLVRENG